MLVRLWAGRRQLASPRDGSPSPYCWALLAINHLQCLGVLPCLQAPELLAGRTAEHWDRGYGFAPDGRSVQYTFCGNPHEHRPAAAKPRPLPRVHPSPPAHSAPTLRAAPPRPLAGGARFPRPPRTP